MATKADDLPEEIWERIFKMLNGDDETLKSLSLVSKSFLTITNRLRFSLNITDKTIPLKITDETITIFQRLMERFPNLTSLTFKIYSVPLQLDSLLTRISTFPNLSHIRSLALFKVSDNFPAIGLRALSNKITNLKSLTCSKMHHVDKNDLLLISDFFPSLEELDLSYPYVTTDRDFELAADDGGGYHFLSLPKLRKVNLYGHRVDRPTIDYLFRNCQLLQEVIFIEWRIWRKLRLTQNHILITL